MKTILIVFAILLILLTLLGTFGGSISYREPFYELSTLAEQEQRSYSKVHFEDMPSSYVPDMPSSDVPDMLMSNMPPSDSSYGNNFVVTDIDDSLKSPPVEGFYNGPVMPPPPPGFDKIPGFNNKKAGFMPELPVSSPPMGQPHPPANMSPSGQSMEEFMIEPFEQDSKSSYPAAY